MRPSTQAAPRARPGRGAADRARSVRHFAAGRTGLEPRFLEETVAAINQAEAAFLDRMGDAAASGPAKAMLSLLQARGVPLDDPEAIDAALSGLGPLRLPRPAPSRRPRPADARSRSWRPPGGRRSSPAWPPSSTPTARAASSPRKPSPPLADARILVGLLGTDDPPVRRATGDKTSKTRSAAELPELAFTIRWATGSGRGRR